MFFKKNKTVCGGIKSPLDKRDRIKSYVGKATNAVLVGDTLVDYVGSIVNQGNYGSCGGCAGVYLANILMCKALGKPYDFKLNPMFSYYWGKYYSNFDVHSDVGSTARGVLKGMQKQGVWSCSMRYPESDIPADFNSERAFKIQNYERINGLGSELVENLKYTLSTEKLPVMATIMLYEENIDAKTGAMNVVGYENEIGYHIMCICGSEEELGETYFIPPNSWGKDWGDNGFAKIHQDVIANFSLTAELWCPIKEYY